jgi:hypothetical protein
MDGLDLSGDKTPEEAEIEEIHGAISLAIRKVREDIRTGKGVKTAVPDLLKLLQLRKELEGSRPRHISVRWIDECETSTE